MQQTEFAHAHMKERLEEFEAFGQEIAKRVSEPSSCLHELYEAEEGAALSCKSKELINVALGVAAQCDWCIAFHVQHAASAGATREEIMEAGFLEVLMHGGPALAYLNPLVDAIDEFLPQKRA